MVYGQMTLRTKRLGFFFFYTLEIELNEGGNYNILSQIKPYQRSPYKRSSVSLGKIDCKNLIKLKIIMGILTKRSCQSKRLLVDAYLSLQC